MVVFSWVSADFSIGVAGRGQPEPAERLERRLHLPDQPSRRRGVTGDGGRHIGRLGNGHLCLALR